MIYNIHCFDVHTSHILMKKVRAISIRCLISTSLFPLSIIVSPMYTNVSTHSIIFYVVPDGKKFSRMYQHPSKHDPPMSTTCQDVWCCMCSDYGHDTTCGTYVA